MDKKMCIHFYKEQICSITEDDARFLIKFSAEGLADEGELAELERICKKYFGNGGFISKDSIRVIAGKLGIDLSGKMLTDVVF